jgi:hypothetical protein
MERPGYRLNVTLDPEHAARLTRLAERTHVQEGTLARSLLSAAIEEADPHARNIVAIVDGIPGAYEHAMQNLDRARAGEIIPLDEFSTLAEVRLSVDAVNELDRMIVPHSLPPNTRERVRRSLRVLEQFSRIG